jgi:acyl-CoA synthetase (NDP forming)
LTPLMDAQRKPIVFWSYTLPSNFAREGLAQSGAVVLSGLTYVGVALRRLVDHAKFRLPSVAKAHSLPLSNIGRHLTSATLSEYDSKALLRAAGIDVPEEMLVTDESALAEAMAEIGFPLAMKIQSPDIPHKSEIGGVLIDIPDRDAALLAYDGLLARARAHRPAAMIQGVLVSPMARKGVEIIVGTMTDETFGPMVMVGSGGITAELLRDVVYRPAPVSPDEAITMLGELKTAPLLNGFRGAAKADVTALAKLVADISQLASALKSEISGIELNPVLVHPAGEGVTVVDALVVRKS